MGRDGGNSRDCAVNIPEIMSGPANCPSFKGEQKAKPSKIAFRSARQNFFSTAFTLLFNEQ